MCDKYTISEKIELVTLISALKDYNEVIKRNPNSSRKPNRSYIWKLVKTWGTLKLKAFVISQDRVTTSSSLD